MSDDPRARRILTDVSGAAACDDLWLTARCPEHGDGVVGPTSLYPDLVTGVEDLARRTIGRAAPTLECPGCGGAAKVVALRLHTFVREAGRDLVLGWSADAPDDVALRWADGEAVDVGSELDAWLSRDAAIRQVSAWLDLAQRAKALEVARGVIAARPRDPALLDLVPLVAGAGAPGWSLAREVVLADGRPEAARALARAALDASSGDDPPPLDDAVSLLGQLGATSTRDDALLVARLLRAQGAFDAAEAAFAAVAAEHPTCAEAHLALGELATDPSLALEHLARAASAAPRDAAVHVARARVLLRLERFDEAGAALEAARALDEAAPRLRRVWHELRRRTGREPDAGPRVVLEVVGLDAWGEATLERGVLSLRTPSDPPDDAARDLACDLGLIQGSILARDPSSGAPLRLFQVQGDGRCADVAPLDDEEALELFAEEFAAMWEEDAGAASEQEGWVTEGTEEAPRSPRGEE